MNVSLLRSLRFRMPLVVLTGIIPLMLISIFFASDRATKKIREEARENMALKAELLAESVDRWNQLNSLAVLSLSKQPDMVEMNPARQEDVMAELLNTYDHFYLAMTANLEGWNIARSDRKNPVYFGDREWFLGAKAGNDLTYQTLIGRTTKRLALCISAPIQDKATTILSVAVMCTDLEDIVQQIGELKFGDTGYAFLVDENGTVLAHPDPEFVSGERLKDYSFYPPVRHLLQGDEGHFTYQDYRGVDWVSYDIRLDNGWGLIVVQEKWEFSASEQDFQNRAFILATIAVLGVSVITWFLANRLISPIGNLTSAASAIAKGDLDLRVKTRRKDELGILANSFNIMADRLKGLFNNLESQIEQRTAQLKEAKEAAEKAKEKAEAANIAKDRFLANISHELRTPLNSILGYTKIILLDNDLKKSHIQDLKIVEQSGSHLLTLINDILDFSKAKADKMELHPTNLQLSTFLTSVVNLVKMWGKEKELKIESEWHNLPSGIRVDEQKLRQVLVNLLGNAIKFTKEGKVTLKVRVLKSIPSNDSSAKQKLRFEVIDTGVGMSPQEIEKIFQPFEQVGEFQSRSAGTGLGLSISKEIVELMGGELKVKSNLNIGSTFWFDLTVPVISGIVKPLPQKIKGKVLGYKGKQRKILVVDDRQENRLLLVKMLQPKGFEIATANDGQEMIETALSFQPDLILMDLFMPVKTGFTSAREIRRIPQLKDIPIIVVTASSITKDTGMYLECEAILHKPIYEDELLENIQEHLQLEWTYQENVDRVV